VRLESSWIALASLLCLACYEQPTLSPQRPLRCLSSQGVRECPNGFACIADRVCAPVFCERNEDCPSGLSCTGRGCVLLGDGGEPDAMGGPLPGDLDGGRPGNPDAIGVLDASTVSPPSMPDAGLGLD
jgi:hypothetical protein